MDEKEAAIDPCIITTFENTLSAFAQGFHVRHIATTNLVTCLPEDQVSVVLQRFPGYDQFPVQRNGHIIGILERNDSDTTGFVAECMHPLDECMLVAAEEPLLRFLPLMAHPPYYRLVLDGTRISALVTRSDVLKLPVRLLGFALVTNLELVMKEVVNTQLPDPTAWLALLSEGRRAHVMKKKSDFEMKRLDPPLVELTDFCDKRDILKRHLSLCISFCDDLKDIEDLRNSLAHAGTFVTSDADLQKFIETLDKTRRWADILRIYIDN